MAVEEVNHGGEDTLVARIVKIGGDDVLGGVVEGVGADEDGAKQRLLRVKILRQDFAGRGSVRIRHLV